MPCRPKKEDQLRQQMQSARKDRDQPPPSYQLEVLQHGPRQRNPPPLTLNDLQSDPRKQRVVVHQDNRH